MADIVSTVRADSATTSSTEPAPNTTTPVTPPVPVAKPAEPATAPAPKEGAAWAAIKASERKLQAARDAIKAEREQAKAELAAERAQHEADLQALQEYRQARANAKRDPFKALDTLGLNYDALTEAKLNGGTTTPDLVAQDVDAKIAALQKQLQDERAAEKAAAEEARTVEEQQLIDTFHKNTTEWVKQPEQAAKYELLTLYGQQDQVGQYVQNQWEQNGRDVSREQAAQELETYLQSEAEKLLATKWFKSRGKPTEPSKAPVPKAAPSESSAVPETDDIVSRMRSTLNNSMTRSTAPAPENSFEARLAAAKAVLDKA